MMACMVVGIAAAELDRVHERIAGRFARSEPPDRQHHVAQFHAPGHVASMVLTG